MSAPAFARPSGWAAVLLLALASCGSRGTAADAPHSSGARALSAGRVDEAVALLDEALVAAGATPDPRLLHDHGLAALRAGAFARAEASARALADVDAVERSAQGWLLVGATALARADLARAQATGPEAEPFAFDAAIALARRARAAFERAAVLRVSWPVAVRNAERARRRVVVWSAERDGREPPDSRRLADGTPDVQLVPTDDGATSDAPRDEAGDDPAGVELTDLSAAELRRLLELLDEDEDRRLAARAQRRARRSQDVEKDW